MVYRSGNGQSSLILTCCYFALYISYILYSSMVPGLYCSFCLELFYTSLETFGYFVSSNNLWFLCPCVLVYVYFISSLCIHACQRFHVKSV